MKYKEVEIGQKFQCKKKSLVVLKIEKYPNTGYNEGELYRLSFDDPEENWYGWAEREISNGTPL